MVKAAPDGNDETSFRHFVEVGSWKGQSAAFMAVEIANSGKNIQFDCVDTWQGSVEHQTEPSVVNGTLYEEFIHNMQPVEGYYRPVRMSSVEAAECYDDESLDFVFIDAGHMYADVKADILAWLPKVKKGGIIAGHDYHPHLLDEVAGAVLEIFGEVPVENTCWIKQL
jgi:SAM-dependent methyltransferase